MVRIITDYNVLIAVLIAMEKSKYPIPVHIISDEYGKMAGFMSGDGMTMTFGKDK